MPTIRNLVFAGGSVKVTAYEGFLEVAEKLDPSVFDMKNIKRVAGTSGGAIAAMLLAIGCDSQQVKQILRDFDFRKVLDDPESGVQTNNKVLRSVEKHEAGHSKFFSKIPAKTVKAPLINRVVNNLGIYEGEYFRDWADNLIRERVKKLTSGRYDGVNLTFKELHALAEAYPGIFRDLYVVGVNVNTGKKEIFSYENPKTENVIIADALAISMAIPFLFKPQHVYYKVEGKRMVDAKRHLWVDGGWYEKYPIRCFDNVAYFAGEKEQLPPGSAFYNQETLGCCLVSDEQKNYFQGATDNPPEKEINNLFAYGLALLKGSMSKQNDDLALSPEDKKRTIFIPHLGISTFAFYLTDQQVEALIASGRRSAELHFKGQSNVIIPSLNPEATESGRVLTA